MQHIVGGHIEVVDYGDNILLVCNENGKLKGELPNIFLEKDIIVGTVLFCRRDGEEMVGLTPEQTEKILKQFENRNCGNENMSIPPEKIKEYIRKGGIKCPFCGSCSLTAGSPSFETDQGKAWQGIICCSCNAEWLDEYSLTGLDFSQN